MAFYMIQQAIAESSPIRVVSDDKDVLLILTHPLHNYTIGLPSTTELSVETCCASQTVIKVNDVVKEHAANILNVLAARALTGCDSGSSIAAIGKATVLKKLVTFTYTQT